MEQVLTMLRASAAGFLSAEVMFVLLIAGAVFVLALASLGVAAALSDPVRRRLGELSLPGNNAPRGRLAEFLQPFARYATPQKQQELSRVATLLTHAGYRSSQAQPIYYAVKGLLTVGLPICVFLASPLFPKLTSGTLLMYAAAAAVIGMLAPSIWLDRQVSSRQRELRASFPDALDLLVVCIESGLGLAPALQRVADELDVSHPDLASELSIVNAEMRAGVERTQALRNMADRTGLADIRGLVALLVQTMRFGTSVADALRVYSEEFRDKRMQAAEEQAAKIGTKMIFPLVLCLFPSFFLVAIGPAVLRVIEAFSQIPH